VCNLFLVCEPLGGWRNVMVSQRRTRIDWAHCDKELVDVHHPDAEQIVLVQDNLNTHQAVDLDAGPHALARAMAGVLTTRPQPRPVSKAYEDLLKADFTGPTGVVGDGRIAAAGRRWPGRAWVSAWLAPYGGAGRAGRGGAS